MIVVVPPGASMDSIVRIVADKPPVILGRSIVVEYPVGGTGLVAASFMKSTPPMVRTSCLRRFRRSRSFRFSTRRCPMIPIVTLHRCVKAQSARMLCASVRRFQHRTSGNTSKLSPRSCVRKHRDIKPGKRRCVSHSSDARDYRRGPAAGRLSRRTTATDRPDGQPYSSRPIRAVRRSRTAPKRPC